MEQETLVYPLADNTVLQDKYTILSVLNAGGFGITYLALDNPGSRYVVIKECMPDAYACRDMETGVVHPRNEQTAVNFSQSVSNSRQEASVLSSSTIPALSRCLTCLTPTAPAITSWRISRDRPCST